MRRPCTFTAMSVSFMLPTPRPGLPRLLAQLQPPSVGARHHAGFYSLRKLRLRKVGHLYPNLNLLPSFPHTCPPHLTPPSRVPELQTPQVRPPPFPSPSPSPPLTLPPVVSSQGYPRLSIAPIPLVQAATISLLERSTGLLEGPQSPLPARLSSAQWRERPCLCAAWLCYTLSCTPSIKSQIQVLARKAHQRVVPADAPRATPPFFSSISCISCLSDSLPALHRRTLARAGPSAWTTALPSSPG